MHMRKCTARGISLPIEIMKKIDSERGDIPRSKYILRILEKKYGEKKLNEISMLS